MSSSLPVAFRGVFLTSDMILVISHNKETETRDVDKFAQVHLGSSGQNWPFNQDPVQLTSA